PSPARGRGWLPTGRTIPRRPGIRNRAPQEPPMTARWFALRNEEAVPSPALLVYPDRVAANLDRMVSMAGHPSRLRPHIKTTKTSRIVAMQVERGITRAK